MPVVNGRLVCVACGTDLGDAGDPYRDPDCHECLRRDMEAEVEFERLEKVRMEDEEYQARLIREEREEAERLWEQEHERGEA